MRPSGIKSWLIIIVLTTTIGPIIWRENAEEIKSTHSTHSENSRFTKPRGPTRGNKINEFNKDFSLHLFLRGVLTRVREIERHAAQAQLAHEKVHLFRTRNILERHQRFYHRHRARRKNRGRGCPFRSVRSGGDALRATLSAGSAWGIVRARRVGSA